MLKLISPRDTILAPQGNETLGSYLLRVGAPLGVEHFSWLEVLTMRRLKITVDPPPQALWPNIIPTLQFCEELRHRIGHPLIVGNGYRPKDANKRIGGATHSAHLYFRALDLDLPQAFCTAIHQQVFYEQAARLWLTMAGQPIGLGFYSKGGGTRLHVDTFHKPWRLFPARRHWKRAYSSGVIAKVKRELKSGAST